MKRRRYLSALAALLGTSVAGCATQGDPSMTQDEAEQQFDDVQEFEDFGAYDSAVRAVDKEAGVVIYAATNASHHAGQGMGLSCIPLDDTDLVID